MRKRGAGLYIGAATLVAAGLFSTTGVAGPEQISYPKDYASWEKYASVDRYDNKQFRELYTSPAAVKAVREGQPIPDGTVIAMAIHAAKLDDKGLPVKDSSGRFVKDKLTGVTVMEKRKGWGDSVPAEYRNGDWQYASFMPDGTPNAEANTKTQACFTCHLPHAKQDFVISLASLAGKFPTETVQLKSGATSVGIQGFSFGPTPIKVTPGQEITWTNADDSPHQITVKDKSLKTAVLLKGDSGSLKFEEAGTYEYGCALHPAMKGSVEVAQ